jgi:hypothetical protein
MLLVANHLSGGQVSSSKTALRISILAISLLSFSFTAAGAIDLIGSVKDNTSALPISGAIVEIYETGDSTTTAGDGSYEFLNLEPGQYTLMFWAENYEPAIISNVSVGSCCISNRGNINSDPDDKVNVSDVTFIVAYLFCIPAGPSPLCLQEGNANGDPDEKINVSDLTYLTSFLFGIPSGPAPPPCP